MIQRISIEPHQVKGYTCLSIHAQGILNGFPLLSIDRDSYIVGAEVQSGLNFAAEAGRHCVAIGKACSLAEAITFMIDLNHNYASVCQGEASFLRTAVPQSRIRRKGSIIIQNDVWVGHGATIMSGVTLHNGCIAAAQAVVTKDVPPYAVVGGNPARILRYRFEPDIIDGLQKIAWWDWTEQLQIARGEDFALPPRKFVEKYLPEAEARLQAHKIDPCTDIRERETALFIPDFSEPLPLYRKVLAEYFSADRPSLDLLIYLPKSESIPKNLNILSSLLQQYEERDCGVILQTGEDIDEHILFQCADYYITTRSRETVYRTCLADLYQTKILYGTDEPIFQ